MKKEELLDELDAKIDDEINIRNLQEDGFIPDRLMTLYEIRDMIEQWEDE